MNTIQIDSKQTKMVAHRGVSGLETENTHAAFVAAGNRSYWGIETDVHVTSDGGFVCYHDNTPKRLTGLDAVIEEVDYDTLRALPLRDLRGGEHTKRADLCMPSLAEYIRICKKYEKIAVLELKNAMTEEQVGAIVKVIKEEDYLDGVVFISFNFDNLVYMRRYCPGQTAQFLFTEFTEEIFEAVKTHGFDMDVRYNSLTEEWMKRLKAAGIKVNCWTVDDPAEAEKLISWGVDFITTNILE